MESDLLIVQEEMEIQIRGVFFGCAMWHLSRPVSKPMPPAMEAWSPNHGATRKAPCKLLLVNKLHCADSNAVSGILQGAGKLV